MKLTLVNRWRIVRPLRYLAKCLPTSCRRKWCSSKFFFFHSDITCHHCTSNVSFADCARKQTEVSCTLPRNRCVKLKYSNRGNYQKFYKGCAATEECKVTSDKSFVECCDDNLCNKGNYNFSFFSILIFFLLLYVGSCSWVLLLHVAIRWSQVNFDQSVITITLSTKFFKWRYERMLTSVTVILLKKFATKNIQNLDIHDDNSMMNRFKCSRNARIISLPQFIRSQNPSLLRKITKLII